MLKIEIDTQPGGIRVRRRPGTGLTFHRRDGSVFLVLKASYADDRALATAAHALNFMLGKDHAHTATRSPDCTDSDDHKGDGGQA